MTDYFNISMTGLCHSSLLVELYTRMLDNRVELCGEVNIITTVVV